MLLINYSNNISVVYDVFLLFFCCCFFVCFFLKEEGPKDGQTVNTLSLTQEEHCQLVTKESSLRTSKLPIVFLYFVGIKRPH